MAGHGGCTQTPEQYARPRQSKARSKLQQIRMAYGMTQQQLADQLGVKQAAIAAMERKPILGIAQAQKIAPIFGMEWKDLL